MMSPTSDRQSPTPAFQPPTLHKRFHKLNAASSHLAARRAGQGIRTSIWQLLFTPLCAFFRIYLWKGAWRQGRGGLVVALFSAYQVFICHAKLWEIQQGFQRPTSSVP